MVSQGWGRGEMGKNGERLAKQYKVSFGELKIGVFKIDFGDTCTTI